jgi:alanine dehydrogenase
VQTTVVDHDLTDHASFMRELLGRTDVLIDATQRPDPSRIIIPNEWVGDLPAHAVILDLSVDPEDRSATPPTVKGIEGIPRRSLGQYVFAPDDPAFDTMHESIDTRHRRHVVSCYSWPAINAVPCMEHYAQQLEPMLEPLVRKGYDDLSPHGGFFERALYRASLRGWLAGPDDPG